MKEAKSRGVVKLLSRVMDVSPQTIQRWKRQAQAERAPKIGRPRITKERRAEIKTQVAREMARQGNPGWRAISRALPGLSVRCVQECVAEIKLAQRKRERMRRKEMRTSTIVLAREAIWGIDGTQIGERKNGAVDAQVIRDFGSCAFRAIRTGAAAKTEDALVALNAAGEPPLVISSDNGSPYCSEAAQAWLRERKVVHLRSLPRTPQHNGAMEIAIRELKELCDAPETLPAAACLLNANRMRASKGYKTSAVLDAQLPVAYHRVDRAVFYEECMARLSEVAKRPTTWRERRKSEREVIYATLEKFGLIRRTGGGALAVH